MGRGGGFSSHRSAPRSSRSMSSGGRSTSHSSLRSGPSLVCVGRDSDYVVDERARNIFLNYADAYYTDVSLSGEEYFAKVFRVSADSIVE